MEVNRTEHKGLVIKRTDKGDLTVLVHKRTFLKYLDENVAEDALGWSAFRGIEYRSQRFVGWFTKLIPITKKTEKP